MQEAFLQSLEPTPEAEELAIVKQRFDTFEKEMNLTEGKGKIVFYMKSTVLWHERATPNHCLFATVDTVNSLAKELCDSNHPSTEQIMSRRDEVNANWEKLQALLNLKREELQAASGLCNFHIDVNETMVS